MRNRSLYALVIVAVVAACSDFPEPEALDATPIYGCYTASGSPTLGVTAKGVRIAGSEATIPYRYEMHKIGAVLRMPIVAEVIKGRNTFQRSEDHFYRLLFAEGQPVIRVAFGKDGKLSDYVRYSNSDCSA